ncbi:Acetylornithine deacetylase [Pseudooceanicola marinus]|uniref:Acetylornithine deacetylase n=1 Tax=Pseudooceanicola marinus TaxID=396013 RepID=A0A1X6ZKR5_9RHOB|nr:acetylornithine deacetylase [Pseudooceanicola marinus]PJE31606.1 acetylornithine deacetylase [Pseudooceanicola marinus]SLN54600.1 Acetylornithine deacetylase [Pseudooceanicola marinus]
MDSLSLLDTLIAFDTTARTSNLDLIDFVESYLTERGFRVTRVMAPEGDRAGLYAAIGPEGAGGVMLSAHTDVVPVAGQEWTRPPFQLTREGDRLYGRGTTDMKGYLAAMLALADNAAGADLAEPLKLAISYDEEIGCVGIQAMIDQLEPAIGLPRLCFVGEPSEMQVTVGHKGKAAFRAVCHGQSGHSALAPQFTNALHLATDFVAELRALQEHYARDGARDEAYGVPYSTIHVGTLSGGTALNIVPDRAELTFEFRHLAADDPDTIRAQIRGAADRVSAAHEADARIEVEEVNAYPGLDQAEEAEVTTFAMAMAQTNSVTKVAFGTEAGFFEALGIPTVVCGPGSMDGQGHKPDEYIELDQLRACDAMLERVLDSLRI